MLEECLVSCSKICFVFLFTRTRKLKSATGIGRLAPTPFEIIDTNTIQKPCFFQNSIIVNLERAEFNSNMAQIHRLARPTRDSEKEAYIR